MKSPSYDLKKLAFFELPLQCLLLTTDNEYKSKNISHQKSIKFMHKMIKLLLIEDRKKKFLIHTHMSSIKIFVTELTFLLFNSFYCYECVSDRKDYIKLFDMYKANLHNIAISFANFGSIMSMIDSESVQMNYTKVN